MSNNNSSDQFGTGEEGSEMTIAVRTLTGKTFHIQTNRNAVYDYADRRPIHQPQESNFFSALRRNVITELGWAADFALAAVEEYRRFLVLKLVLQDWDADILSPAALIDRIWHVHILDTRNYAEDCRHIFDVLGPAQHSSEAAGISAVNNPLFQFVHHSPAMAHDDKGEERLRNTLQAYRAHFNAEPDPLYWSDTAVPVMASRATAVSTLYLLDTISATEGICTTPDQMRLVFHGREMQWGRSLTEHGVNDGDVLHLVLRLRC